MARTKGGQYTIHIGRMSVDSDSDESSSSRNSGRLDQFGRPFQKPSYSSTEEPPIVARLRQFLPLLEASTKRDSDPRIDSSTSSKSGDILLPRVRSSSDISDSSQATDSSYGIEIDVGCGVFEVNGEVDEVSLLRNGVPIIQDSGCDLHESQSRSVSLIQELDYN